MKKLFSFFTVILFLCVSINSYAQTIVIDPNGDGGFENGASFAANGWTGVNGAQVNQFFVGTLPTGLTGVNAAYVSSNSGTSWSFNNVTPSVVHFYRDVTFPAGETDIELTFDINGFGESTFDYLRVFLVSTATTPVAGTLLGAGQIGLSNYNGQGVFIKAGIQIPAANAGTTQRLIFSWNNDNSAGTNPPIAIDNIKLLTKANTPLSGIYTVDNTAATSLTNFNSLTEAVLALNNNGISASVTMNVTAGQTYFNLLNTITATGTVANTITFQRSGVGANPLLKGNYPGGSTTAATDGLIVVSGGDYFTFDGIDVTLASASLGGFATTNPVEFAYLIRNGSTTNGATNNTIKNSSISLNRNNTSSVAILQSASTTFGGGFTPASLLGTNANNLYQDLVIKNVYNGILLTGNATNADANNEIGTLLCTSFNTIGDPATANDLGNGSTACYGIKASNQNNVKIHNNSVRNVTNTGGQADGIFLDLFQGTSSVYQNKIQTIKNASTSSTTAIAGIRASHTTTGTNVARIYVNAVSEIISGYTGAASITRTIKGIFVSGTGGSTSQSYEIWNNSVSINGSSSPNISSTCFSISTASGPTYIVRNNIFSNSTPAQGATAKHFCWESTSATLIGPSPSSISNNNNLYIANDAGVSGFVGRGNTTNYTTVPNWTAGITGNANTDLNSFSVDPLFTGVGNLHSAAAGLSGTGTARPAYIIADLDCATWTGLDIGAYIVFVINNDVGVVSSTLNVAKIYSIGKGYDFSATVQNFGALGQSGVDVYYKQGKLGTAVGPVNTGAIGIGGTAPVNFTGGFALTPTIAGPDTIRIYTSLPGDQAPSNDTLSVILFIQTKISTLPYLETFNIAKDWTVIAPNPVGPGIYGIATAVNPDGVAADPSIIANFDSPTSNNGRIEVLRSPEFDFTGISNPVLHFYVAYKTFSTQTDRMEVLVSVDGGLTFNAAATSYNKIWSSNPSLSTLPAQALSFFPTNEIQWRHETVDLSNVGNNANVVIGWKATSNWGNNAWIDNVIVTALDPNSLCVDNVITAPPTASYNCNSLVTLVFNGTPAPPPLGGNNPGNAGLIKTEGGTDVNIKGMPSQVTDVKFVSGNETDNPLGGKAYITQYTLRTAAQTVTNTTGATPPSGPAYTPLVVYNDYWFTITYDGNDYQGYANYDLKINLSTLFFLDPTKLYIVKRTDSTGVWACLNTTLVGNDLVVSGLTDFCDFALAGDEPLPVELSSFVSSVSGNNVNLNWSTAAEINNAGFDIERSVVNGSWSKVGNVDGNGTSTTGHNYSFTDRNLAAGSYSYRLKQIDFNGNYEYFNLSNEVNIGIPDNYSLSQNYPNPFNPSTSINFALPNDGKVSLKIFDMSGKEVMTLVNEVKTAGYYSYNFNASSLSSGVYFYRLSANNFTATKKMMLIK